MNKVPFYLQVVVILCLMGILFLVLITLDNEKYAFLLFLGILWLFAHLIWMLVEKRKVDKLLKEKNS